MLTPQALIAELKRLGYETTPRRLTDWLQKGLLPPLCHKGRGQGRGSVYYWPRTDVIAQAVTVHELLARKSRTEAALLGTWFAGYPIAIDRVRQVWLTQLQQDGTRLKLDVSNTDQLQDRLGEWAAQGARKLADQHGLARDALSDLYLDVLSLLFDPDYNFDAKTEFGLFQAFHKTINNRRSSGKSWVDVLDLIEVQRAADFIKKHFSLQSRRRLIEEASDESLERAQLHWRIVCDLGRRIGFLVAPHDQPAVQARSLSMFPVAFGSSAISLALVLYKLGYGAHINRLLLELVDFCNKTSMLHEPTTAASGTPMSENLKAALVELRHRVQRAWNTEPETTSLASDSLST